MCSMPKNGDTIWQKDRDEGNAWATPRVIKHSGKTQVITAGTNFIRSYDLLNGDIIWQCSGLGENAIPCPVVEDGVVYCMSGYKRPAILALPLSSQGDISDSDNIIWSDSRGTPYVSSPAIYNGMLYFNQSNEGILSCLDSKTGKPIISRTRLPNISNIYSSPVAAAGRVYITGRQGVTLVLNQAKELDIIATNSLEDRIDASPALAGNQLFLRGRKFLYCIESEN